ncbi:MAG: hypothetical protein L3J97_05905 [Thermoplasmata archaeon]|nr:hypothetical protein [Thermoplasmata archaeon]
MAQEGVLPAGFSKRSRIALVGAFLIVPFTAWTVLIGVYGRLADIGILAELGLAALGWLGLGLLVLAWTTLKGQNPLLRHDPAGQRWLG